MLWRQFVCIVFTINRLHHHAMFTTRVFVKTLAPNLLKQENVLNIRAIFLSESISETFLLNYNVSEG